VMAFCQEMNVMFPFVRRGSGDSVRAVFVPPKRARSGLVILSNKRGSVVVAVPRVKKTVLCSR
jgi:hypothetical protein